MKPSRMIFIITLMLIFPELAACDMLQPVVIPTITATSITEPAETQTAIPAITSTASSQPESPQTETPSGKPGYYENSEYMFSFRIPEGWTLEEIHWEEMEGTKSAIILTKDYFRMTLEFKTVFEDIFIGPRGLGGSDVEIVKLDEIPIFGKAIAGHSHVSDGRVKRILYGVNTNELRFFAGLGHETGPDLDFTWENIEIPQEIQSEFLQLLQTLTRTGEVKLPESVALLADIPLILPMEKTYYSQLYDTDVANACGPAAALMVLDYHGLEESIDVVINQLKNMPGPGAFDPGCYVNTVCTSPDALTRLLFDYGLQVHSHEDWTLAEIFAVVSKGKPVIADILWEPSTESLGHFVVIYGVDLNQQILYYHDPYRGSEMTAHWDDFASLWEGKVDVGDPLKPEGHRFWGLQIGQKQDTP